MAGTATVAPYFTKRIKEKGTPWSWSWPVHMIPARAPVGVKKAPRLEPMTVAYNAGANRAAVVRDPASMLPTTELYSTLMGMLLTILAAKKEEIPKEATVPPTVSGVDKNLPKTDVMPY